MSWIDDPKTEPAELSLPLPDTQPPSHITTAPATSANKNPEQRPSTSGGIQENDVQPESAAGWSRVTSWIRGSNSNDASNTNPDSGTNPGREPMDESQSVPELSASFRPPIVLVTNRRGVIRWEMAPHSEAYPRYAYETNQFAFTGDRFKASQSVESGLNAARGGNLQQALQRFGEAVEQDPSYFEALFNLAITSRKLNRPRIAMRALESALWVNPEHEPSRMQFAALLYQNNYLIDAAQEWETVLRENPDQAQAHFLMGRLLDQEFRRPDLAKPHYTRVLQLEPNHPQAGNIRTWLAWFP